MAPLYAGGLLRAWRSRCVGVTAGVDEGSKYSGSRVASYSTNTDLSSCLSTPLILHLMPLPTRIFIHRGLLHVLDCRKLYGFLS